jgi:hypothetical protein
MGLCLSGSFSYRHCCMEQREAKMKRTSLAYQYASAHPVAPDQSKWRGYIDGWDPSTGIHGWALATDTPSGALRLELLVGDTPLSSLETDRSRPDLADLLQVPVTAGFRFTPDLFPQLAKLNPRRSIHRLNVRVAGTNVLLKGREPLPTVARMVELWRDTLLASRVPPQVSFSKTDQLRARMSLMRTDSESFRGLPLRPAAENEIGHIERLYPDPQGLIWFIGWIAREFDTEFPAVIIDRQKFSAGIAAFTYERADLASRFVGIIGAMDTAWVPPAVGGDFFVYVGQNARRHLRATAATKLFGAEAFLAAFRETEAVASRGHASAMSALLGEGDPWLPGSAVATGTAADASLDRLFLVPGFGCFLEGWSVSPAKRVQTCQLKLGDCVMAADDDATYFRPRPDLDCMGAGLADRSRAGFVSLLRGDLPQAVTGPYLLRVIYSDGTSFVKRLDPKVLRRLDCMTDSTEVLRLYPSLRHERHYQALRDAIERQQAVRARWPVIVAVSPRRRLVVVTLPSEPSNIRLCFDHVARLQKPADPNLGICFVARRTVNLPQARLLFEEFRESDLKFLSLVCVEDEFDGFAALPFVLSKLDAERFVYVDAGYILTQKGWREAIHELGLRGHSIRFLQVIDDAGSPDRVNGELTAACFQWTTAAFLQWQSSARRFVRGVFRNNGLPPLSCESDLLTASAMRIERAPMSRLADMIDEDLLIAAQSSPSHA